MEVHDLLLKKDVALQRARDDPVDVPDHADRGGADPRENCLEGGEENRGCGVSLRRFVRRFCIVRI